MSIIVARRSPITQYVSGPRMHDPFDRSSPFRALLPDGDLVVHLSANEYADMRRAILCGHEAPIDAALRNMIAGTFACTFYDAGYIDFNMSVVPGTIAVNLTERERAAIAVYYRNSDGCVVAFPLRPTDAFRISVDHFKLRPQTRLQTQPQPRTINIIDMGPYLLGEVLDRLSPGDGACARVTCKPFSTAIASGRKDDADFKRDAAKYVPL